jgi:hypothetical protein
MTEQQQKTLWSILVCAVIVAFFALQQSWVKHRPIEAAHERANEQ